MARGTPFYLNPEYLQKHPKQKSLIRRELDRIFYRAPEDVESEALRYQLVRFTLGLIAAGSFVAVLSVAPGATRGIKWIVDALRESEHPYAKKLAKQRRIAEVLQRLHTQRFIEFQKIKAKKYRVQLTSRGRARLLGYIFEDLAIPRQDTWDGKWRLVIFDIPEQHKSARDALRHKLRQLGFLQLQKSAFVYPYPCLAEIDFIAELFNVWRYITFIETKDLGRQEPQVRAHFDFI